MYVLVMLSRFQYARWFNLFAQNQSDSVLPGYSARGNMWIKLAPIDTLAMYVCGAPIRTVRRRFA